MKRTPKLIGIGYCGMDYLCVLPHIPLDEKVEIIDSLIQGGGPAVTAIVAAARLGADTAFLGVVGDDVRGAQIVRGIAAEGIDTAGVKVRKNAMSPAGFCWIDRQSGKRSIAWTRGTARPLTPCEFSRGRIRVSDLLHLDGHQTQAALAAAAFARKHGVCVSIDAGTILPGMEDLLSLSDIVIASETFAVRFTGSRSPETAVRKLFALGRRFAGITLGKRGSIGFDGTRILHCPPFDVPKVVDTTGAGDTYHGAFAFAAAQSRPWEACMRFATVVAALKCTRFGGRTGIPDLRTAEQHLKHFQIIKKGR
ncbi:MAG: PfkB family carbohydrate kinase [Kiritimatiellia bacterium]|jgi:sugar/nucleoside kinase (ribokinase family)|nr:PfkB family carbohydrate kinase [Kiritimatiellia bacterium]